jgi:hypothetical protein
MKPLFLAALGLLVVSNAFVLAHVALNRSGEPESEMLLTARELQYAGGSSDDSSVVLMLRWQNTAPEYLVGTQIDDPGWFDAKKLEELGFDLSVPAGSPQAPRFYENLQSRQVYAALEFEGAAWEQWLARREVQLASDLSYGPLVTMPDRISIESQTTSRLVAIDAARDPAALRRKYPDRKRVMILPAVVRAKHETLRIKSAGAPARPEYLRGAITRLAIESINVPAPLSRQFYGQQSYSAYTYDGKQVRIVLPPYSALLRVGSKYEPWITDVKALR